MTNIAKAFVVINLIFIFINTGFGQLVSDSYCKNFENVVATPLNPAHWYHNIVFRDECWLAFDIDFKGGFGLSFKLEKSESERAARKSLHSDIKMYKVSHWIDRNEGFKYPKLPKQGFWDEAYFSESYGPMLLRRKRTFVTIFCLEKKELCLQAEKALRNSPVLNEY